MQGSRFGVVGDRTASALQRAGLRESSFRSEGKRWYVLKLM